VGRFAPITEIERDMSGAKERRIAGSTAGTDADVAWEWTVGWSEE
jgi:hypothetical protein